VQDAFLEKVFEAFEYFTHDFDCDWLLELSSSGEIGE
jgi:hypothetical protein